MPELPEAEASRRYLDSSVLYKKIEVVDVLDERILGNVSKERIISDLEGRQIVHTVRHGKYVGAELDSSQVLILHFGMTGKVRFFKRNESAPRFVTMQLNFENGDQLAFTCIRVLCRVFFCESMKEFIEWKNLGPDALDGLTLGLFKDLISRRTGRIKAVLMDQHFLAGIGNIYADEILFQSGIHPMRTADTIFEDEIAQLFNSIGVVLNEAVDAGANWALIPKDYLLNVRGPGGKCPSCGTQLEMVRVVGRSSYYCPKHQF
ncbi:MAG: Fpg/Nei family DNA glycosylase [Methanomassiliicoccales archaeon]|nr:Fpg/Nei family DNA glycosylase [Methanomassiliicoccales archaeon]